MSAAAAVLPPSASVNLPLDEPVELVEKGPAVDYEPFLADKKYHRTSPPELLTLTKEHEEIYQEVLKHFATEDYVIPEIEDGDSKLTEEEKFFLTYECFLRFLRASAWSASTCITKLENTLKWRREYGVYDALTQDSIKEHGLNGHAFLFGYDVEGRPGFLVNSGRESSPETPERIKLYVWLMERAIEIMPRGVESMVAMSLYNSSSKAASAGHSKLIVSTLQTYYPERLGRCIVTNAPWWMTVLMRIVMPFMDPVTRSKIAVNRQIIAEGDFTPDQLVKEWEGDRVFVWEYDRYMNKLVELSGRMKEKRINKWRELGGRVGLREWDYQEE